MLLIRPLLHANRKRQNKTHIVVFFIFIVSNCGGLLTPLGDPPLYLGFLRGVPFDWTFQLTKEWAFTVFSLLFIFHLLDERQFNKEDLETKGSLVDDVATSQRRLHLDGIANLLLLLCVVLCILVAGYWIQPSLTESHGGGVADWGSKVFQILAMGALTIVSLRITPKTLHEANRFSFAPILEVAALFFGIFGAMIPSLAILEAKGPALPLTEAWHYFWATGLLSGFLDNAPTYLTFVTMAAAKFGVDTAHLGELAARHSDFLAAISCGAVFMGALTYIGNGPNFMVKALAEHAKVRMPSFGGYLLWSLAVLVPLFIIQTFLFF
jgi:Na+/H+ antiporter NhaD/arsenite permease-like protein